MIPELSVVPAPSSGGLPARSPRRVGGALANMAGSPKRVGGALSDSVAEQRRRRRIRRAQLVRSAQAGNTNAARHLVYSRVAVAEDVADEEAVLWLVAPWLERLRDARLVEATARIIVRLRKLDVAIDSDPTSMTLTSMYARLEAQLSRDLDALGLTPQAAARLGIAALDAASRAAHFTEATLARYREDTP